jgi:hypothetical protein
MFTKQSRVMMTHGIHVLTLLILIVVVVMAFMNVWNYITQNTPNLIDQKPPVKHNPEHKGIRGHSASMLGGQTVSSGYSLVGFEKQMGNMIMM